MSCRSAVLEAFHRLERRHGRNTFKLDEIVGEVLVATDAYKVSTIRTHVTSRMCTDAPDHHATTFDDLERVDRALYRRR